MFSMFTVTFLQSDLDFERRLAVRHRACVAPYCEADDSPVRDAGLSFRHEHVPVKSGFYLVHFNFLYVPDIVSFLTEKSQADFSENPTGATSLKQKTIRKEDGFSTLPPKTKFPVIKRGITERSKSLLSLAQGKGHCPKALRTHHTKIKALVRAYNFFIFSLELKTNTKSTMASFGLVVFSMFPKTLNIPSVLLYHQVACV